MQFIRFKGVDGQDHYVNPHAVNNVRTWHDGTTIIVLHHDSFVVDMPAEDVAMQLVTGVDDD